MEPNSLGQRVSAPRLRAGGDTLSGVALAALLISLLALLVSGWAGWNTHRQANAAEEQNAMKREEQAALDARPWRITIFKGATYQLTNVGSLTAYAVALEVGKGRVRWMEEPEGSGIGPGESAVFHAALYSGSSRRVTIRWATQPGGETLECAELLPPYTAS